MIIKLDLKDYDLNARIFKREAARAIISKDNEYLMITSKYGDYKFPGGGVKNGEDYIDALIREVKEETGCRIIPESAHEYITVIERRKGTMGDVLEMESRYYFCQAEYEFDDKNLDDYEEEYEYKEIWIGLIKAYGNNKIIKDINKCPWVTRENIVIKKLLEATE